MTKRGAVRLVRAFEGPRHDRLYKIWDTIAEYTPELTFRWYANPGGKLRHGQCFEKIWEEELEFDNQFLLLTEADWLPDLNLHPARWSGFSLISGKTPVLATERVVRSPRSKRTKAQRGVPGGWFVSINKLQVNEGLTFDHQPDPCNELPKLARCQVVSGEDGYPHHFGMEYVFGTHLFWSRHYNDPPATRVGPFQIGAIQRAVDWRINQWILDQPEDFQALLVERCGYDILGSPCEYTDLRLTFRNFFDNCAASPSELTEFLLRSPLTDPAPTLSHLSTALEAPPLPSSIS